MNPRIRRVAILAAATMLAACGSDTPTTPTAPTTGQQPASPSVIAHASTDTLRMRATAAMAAQRFFSPAGDNAAELLLELRQRGRVDAGDDAALTELQPYLIIAAEQAVERRDADEAQRLVDLLARIDTDAPAIPRLRTAVEGMRAAATSRAAAVAAEARADAERLAQSLADLPPAAPATRPAVRPAGMPPAPVAPAASTPPAPSSPAIPRVAAADTPPPPVPAAAPAAEPPMRVAPALRLVQDAQPRYPARALDRRLDGRVELMFTVRPDGSVADLRVVDAQPAGVFDQAALQAARRWRFAPIPVATTTTRALRFAPPRG
jgi:protein TonB